MKFGLRNQVAGMQYEKETRIEMGKKKIKKELENTIKVVSEKIRGNEISTENRAETMKALASLVESRALLN